MEPSVVNRRLPFRVTPLRLLVFAIVLCGGTVLGFDAIRVAQLEESVRVLREGSTRAEVEAILGPPDRILYPSCGSVRGTGAAYCGIAHRFHFDLDDRMSSWSYTPDWYWEHMAMIGGWPVSLWFDEHDRLVSISIASERRESIREAIRLRRLL